MVANTFQYAGSPDSVSGKLLASRSRQNQGSYLLFYDIDLEVKFLDMKSEEYRYLIDLVLIFNSLI